MSFVFLGWGCGEALALASASDRKIWHTHQVDVAGFSGGAGDDVATFGRDVQLVGCQEGDARSAGSGVAHQQINLIAFRQALGRKGDGLCGDVLDGNLEEGILVERCHAPLGGEPERSAPLERDVEL